MLSFLNIYIWTMRYYSAKNWLFVVIISFMFLMLIVSLLDRTYTVSWVMGGIIAYLLWMWFDTWYMIANGKLYYQSALFKGSVEISTIFQVVTNTTQYSGIKASLSTRGMVIKYNKYDDVYISPKEAKKFANELKAVNPRIELI